MKTPLLITALALAGSSLWAQDFVAPQHRVPQTQAPKVQPHHAAEGAIQRAVRQGNPLQMLNPLAPREYGDGSEFVYYDEGDSYARTQGRQPHAKGLRLFAFSW